MHKINSNTNTDPITCDLYKKCIRTLHIFTSYASWPMHVSLTGRNKRCANTHVLHALRIDVIKCKQWFITWFTISVFVVLLVFLELMYAKNSIEYKSTCASCIIHRSKWILYIFGIWFAIVSSDQCSGLMNKMKEKHLLQQVSSEPRTMSFNSNRLSIV